MKCDVVTGATVGKTYDNQSFINFWTWGNNIAGAKEVVRISQQENVGIGSTLPEYKLDAIGDIRASGLVSVHPCGANGHMTVKRQFYCYRLFRI
jgi:hypothetical protein